jgi:uncharacterized membrane protein SpoIIM required for sporulation
MANKILNNIADLIKVKSMITLTITAAITYGFIKGTVPVELYSTYAGSIITYYFTKRETKEAGDEK